MTDCYIPQSGNFLEPVAPIAREAVEPSVIYDRLLENACETIHQMNRGEIPTSNVVRPIFIYIHNRRYVRVGLEFAFIDGELFRAPRENDLRSIAMQLRAIFN